MTRSYRDSEPVNYGLSPQQLRPVWRCMVCRKDVRDFFCCGGQEFKLVFLRPDGTEAKAGEL